MQRIKTFAACSAALLAGVVAAQQPPAAPAAPQRHVRGDIVSLEGDTLTIKSRSGADVKLKLADNARVATIGKADMSSIGDGTFVGTTAVQQPDGTLRAVEVHVFPDSMRGTGEGHRPWDLQPGSTMTNATVAKVDQGASGGAARASGTGSSMTNATVAKVDESGGGARKLSLKYKDGEKTVIVPAGTPVVKIQPGDKSKLVPGAHVFAIVTRQADGTMLAERLNVGEGGLVPPM
jgi:hypothetical protein